MARRSVFLVGPMGAGKTTVGRRLAQSLGLDFFDTDEEIERRTGATISIIFEIEGEAGFRKREQDRKSTRLNSSHIQKSRMPSSA